MAKYDLTGIPKEDLASAITQMETKDSVIINGQLHDFSGVPLNDLNEAINQAFVSTQPKEPGYFGKILRQPLEVLKEYPKAYSGAVQRIKEGFQDIGAPVQIDPTTGKPITPAWTQKAAHFIGGAVINPPVQVLGAGLETATVPAVKTTNVLLGGLPEKTVQKAAQGVQWLSEKTPLGEIGTTAGQRLAASEKGKTLFEYTQKPEVQANVRTVERGLQALAFGFPKMASVGVRTAGETVGGGLERLFPVAEKRITEGVAKGIKPTIQNKGTLAQIKKFRSNTERAVNTIIDNRSNIQIHDVNGELVNRVPHSNSEFSEAISQAKKIVYDQYSSMSKAAGREGAKFSVAPINEKISQITGDGTYEGLIDRGISHNQAIELSKKINAKLPDFKFSADERAYANSIKNEIADLEGAPPEVVEERIAKLNSELQSFYNAPDRVARAKAQIDGSVANQMREQLDDIITNSLETGGYQDLKNQYGALKAIEKEVNHRAIVQARRANKGFFAITDIWTNAEIIGGIMHQNPVMVTKGLVGKASKAYIEAVNNPDRYIRRMFETVNESRLQQTTPEKFIRGIGPAIERGTSKITDPIQWRDPRFLPEGKEPPAEGDEGYFGVPVIETSSKGGPSAGAIRGNQAEQIGGGQVSGSGKKIGVENLQRGQETGGPAAAPRQAETQGPQDIGPYGGMKIEDIRANRALLKRLRKEKGIAEAKNALSEIQKVHDEMKKFDKIFGKEYTYTEGLSPEEAGYVKRGSPEEARYLRKLTTGRIAGGAQAPGKPTFKAFSKSGEAERAGEPAAGGERKPQQATSETEAPPYSDDDIAVFERLEGRAEERLSKEEEDLRTFVGTLTPDELDLISDPTKISEAQEILNRAPQSFRDFIRKDISERGEALTASEEAAPRSKIDPKLVDQKKRGIKRDLGFRPDDEINRQNISPLKLQRIERLAEKINLNPDMWNKYYELGMVPKIHSLTGKTAAQAAESGGEAQEALSAYDIITWMNDVGKAERQQRKAAADLFSAAKEQEPKAPEAPKAPPQDINKDMQGYIETLQLGEKLTPSFGKFYRMVKASGVKFNRAKLRRDFENAFLDRMKSLRRQK